MSGADVEDMDRDVGQHTMGLNLEPRTVQRVMKSLEDDNSRLQQEVASLQARNRQLQKQILKLQKERTQQEEVVALSAELEERDREVATLRNKLRARHTKREGTSQISAEEALEIQVEELEIVNEKKTREIQSLQHQLMQASHAHNKMADEKQHMIQHIRQLRQDLQDEVNESLRYREERDERDQVINHLQHHLNQHTCEASQCTSRCNDSSSSSGNESDRYEGTKSEVPSTMRRACEGTPNPNRQVSHDYRVPEEDWTFRWKICACGRADCPTCVAETAAMAGVCRGAGCTQQQQPESSHTQRGQHTRYYQQDTEDTRHVEVKKEVNAESYEASKKHIYLFHVSISDSAVRDHHRDHHEAGVETCSISALLFAYKYLTYPSSMQYDGVSDQIFSQVLDSINEANENIRLNFEGRSEQLQPEDTLMANSHLGLKLTEDLDLGESFYETVVPYIFDIGPQQILLIYRMHKYKVLSVMSSEDGKKILIFDPHWHWVRSKHRKSRWFGAFLFSSVRDVEQIETLLSWVERYCGEMDDNCRLAIFEKESK